MQSISSCTFLTPSAIPHIWWVTLGVRKRGAGLGIHSPLTGERERAQDEVSTLLLQ